MVSFTNSHNAKVTVFFLKSITIILLFMLVFNISRADNVLNNINSRLQLSPITSGVFQQAKQLKFLRKPLLSTGTFTYDQKQGVIWRTLTPIASILVLNNTQLWSGQGEQALAPAFGRAFKALLGGQLSQLSEDFEMTGTEQQSSWQLQLHPKDELLMKVINIILLTGDSELRVLEIYEINGNLTKIQFSDIRHPEQLSKEQIADFERLSP